MLHTPIPATDADDRAAAIAKNRVWLDANNVRPVGADSTRESIATCMYLIERPGVRK